MFFLKKNLNANGLFVFKSWNDSIVLKKIGLKEKKNTNFEFAMAAWYVMLENAEHKQDFKNRAAIKSFRIWCTYFFLKKKKNCLFLSTRKEHRLFYFRYFVSVTGVKFYLCYDYFLCVFVWEDGFCWSLYDTSLRV